MNHYNGATVWGTIDKNKVKKTDNRKPYVELYVNCPHLEYGNVRILGRIWASDAVQCFMKHYKKGDDVRLDGNIQQYDGRNDVRKTSFNFYKVLPGPLKERKAAFRLTGEVMAFEDNVLTLVVRQSAEGYEEKEEEFMVYVPEDVLLVIDEDPAQGELVRVKGYLVMEEDDFGELSGTQRPVVKELKKLPV